MTHFFVKVYFSLIRVQKKKEKEKEAGTNFPLLSWSRNMIG